MAERDPESYGAVAVPLSSPSPTPGPGRELRAGSTPCLGTSTPLVGDEDEPSTEEVGRYVDVSRSVSGSCLDEDEDEDQEGHRPEDDLAYPGFVPISLRCLKQTSRPRNWCLKLITWPYPF